MYFEQYITWCTKYKHSHTHFHVAYLYESPFELFRLLRSRQHQISAGVVHAQVINVETGLKHSTQTLHSTEKRHTHAQTQTCAGMKLD